MVRNTFPPPRASRKPAKRLVDFLPKCRERVDVDGDRPRFDFRIAATIRERAQAFNLVHQCYVRSGLILGNSFQLHVTPYQMLPESTIFICSLGTRAVGTVTLIGDGPSGLPMEEIYHDEVQLRRDNGLSVGEISSLAFAKLPRRLFLSTFIQLTRLMSQFARHQQMNQLLIAAHPRHVRFYARSMGFQIMGEEKTYPRVRNKPALAAMLDFQQIDRDRPWCWDAYFGSPIPAVQLQRKPMTEAERNYYSRLLQIDKFDRDDKVGRSGLIEYRPLFTSAIA